MKDQVRGGISGRRKLTRLKSVDVADSAFA
jgi:hypothetical protein